MTKPSDGGGDAGREDPFRELQELGPAVSDVVYQLTHDMSDTSQDVRDALALAPLAAVKVFHACASMIAKRPRRSALVLVGLALAIGALAIARGKRR